MRSARLARRRSSTNPLPEIWDSGALFYNAAMAGLPAVYSPESMRAEKRAVAGNSVVAALAITALKIVVGVRTGSLGILSEALHSGLDLVAAVITLFSVCVSDKPADADHQYGHAKIENFSAFLETGLLLLTCLWIVWEAFKRLFFQRANRTQHGRVPGDVFSIVVDYWRSRSLEQYCGQVRQPSPTSRRIAFLDRYLVEQSCES